MTFPLTQNTFSPILAPPKSKFLSLLPCLRDASPPSGELKYQKQFLPDPDDRKAEIYFSNRMLEVANNSKLHIQERPKRK